LFLIRCSKFSFLGVDCGRGKAPASSKDDAPSSVLGLVPHQIRGHIASFSNLIVTGNGYAKCTACSRVVVDAYRAEGMEFLARVWNDSRGVLEEISGIREMMEGAERAMEGIDLLDGDDDWE
jgi:ubiquitin-like modifier-activating enzyme ATG7